MKITLGDFFDAMEKNGWRKATGAYVVRSKNGDKVLRACAYGQAGLNLDIDPTDLAHRTKLAVMEATKGSKHIYSEITHLNDFTSTSVPNIARKLREEYKDLLEIEL